MFESVNTQLDARTDGRTPARPVYYKLTSERSGELKIPKVNTSMQYTAILSAKKMIIFRLYIVVFFLLLSTTQIVGTP